MKMATMEITSKGEKRSGYKVTIGTYIFRFDSLIFFVVL